MGGGDLRGAAGRTRGAHPRSGVGEQSWEASGVLQNGRRARQLAVRFEGICGLRCGSVSWWRRGRSVHSRRGPRLGSRHARQAPGRGARSIRGLRGGLLPCSGRQRKRGKAQAERLRKTTTLDRKSRRRLRVPSLVRLTCKPRGNSGMQLSTREERRQLALRCACSACESRGR